MKDLVARFGILAIVAAPVVSACSNNSSTSPPSGQTNTLSFFVTSATNPTGNLGGLRGADALCQSLATAVGAGSIAPVTNDRGVRAYSFTFGA
jgi:hypothetical protein